MKRLFVFLGMVFCITQGHAQTRQRTKLHVVFEQFRKEIHEDFENFRAQCMEEFLEFAKNPWKEFEEVKPLPIPKRDEVSPVTFPEDFQSPIKDTPIVIDEVIEPVVITPQPTPVEPIEEVPVAEEKWVSFTFFGTADKVRFDTANCPTLSAICETTVVEALRGMTPKKYDNLLYDCLKIRKERKLCDWAYLQMLKALCNQVCGTDSNRASLMLAYLYMQSGYQMRMAMADNKLYVLYATSYGLYEQPSYTIDGVSYYGVEKLPSRLYICQAAFPKEQRLSLNVPDEQDFAMKESATIERKSLNHPEVKCVLRVNKNLLDFYSSYPTSEVGGNFMTRWAMYANTPLQTSVKEQLYPALKKHLEGKNDLEAIGVLLDFVQMAFVYGYDEKIWGHDRAFFAEETLYYPFADCEDRSILFSRLVRDLVGLDVVLVFYPGHLATAVQFISPVPGDYLMLEGKRYTICDPTYFNAGVGLTMPDMDNKKAKVILLNN